LQNGSVRAEKVPEKTTKKKRKEAAKCGELQEKRTQPVAERCSERKSAPQEKNI
jgi:hypothetical protein